MNYCANVDLLRIFQLNVKQEIQGKIANEDIPHGRIFCTLIKFDKMVGTEYCLVTTVSLSLFR